MTSVEVDSVGTRVECVGDDVTYIDSPDGPMLVRGAERVVDENGQDHPVQRPVVAVCRCGTTTRAPWCDGMHKLLQQRDRAKQGQAD